MVYQKTDDLLDLVTRLQANEEGLGIQDIMDIYHVSKRTAIRMKDLVKLKFPQLKEVSGAHNLKHWYLPSGSLNQYVNFSLDEIVALQNAIKLMKKKDPATGDSLETVLTKVKATMGKTTLNRIEPDAEVLLEAEGYALRPGPKLISNKKFLSKLRNAIIACKVTKIRYVSRKNKDWREVYPYGFLYGNKHYLIAWHTKRQEMCYFDLNKIQEIDVTDEYFTRDPNFSLKEFSEKAFGVYQEEPFNVEWLFDAEVAHEAAHYQFHPNQEMTFNKDGTLTVKFRAGGALEMDWHLYTWGEHVKVIKPENWYTMEKRR